MIDLEKVFAFLSDVVPVDVPVDVPIVPIVPKRRKRRVDDIAEEERERVRQTVVVWYGAGMGIPMIFSRLRLRGFVWVTRALLTEWTQHLKLWKRAKHLSEQAAKQLAERQAAERQLAEPLAELSEKQRRAREYYQKRKEERRLAETRIAQENKVKAAAHQRYRKFVSERVQQQPNLKIAELYEGLLFYATGRTDDNIDGETWAKHDLPTSIEVAEWVKAERVQKALTIIPNNNIIREKKEEYQKHTDCCKIV